MTWRTINAIGICLGGAIGAFIGHSDGVFAWAAAAVIIASCAPRTLTNTGDGDE